MTKVLFYNAGIQSKVDSLRRLLEGKALQGTGITLEEATQENFLQKLTPDVALLVLPGASAGTPYREQLAGAPFDLLKQRMRAGLHVLGICAGAFVLSESFEYSDYDFETGELKGRKEIFSELGIAPLRAYGPDISLYKIQPHAENNPWAAYAATPVRCTVDGADFDMALALSRGPSFTDLSLPACRTLATYKATGNAAVVSFRYGRGGGILSGPMLEVGGTGLMRYVHPRYRDDAHCRETVAMLEQSAPNWARLWSHLCVSLFPHHPQAQAIIRKNFAPATPQNAKGLWSKT